MSLLTKKVMVGAAVALFAIVVPMATLASWSPDRPIKTYNGPGTPGFDHVQFNSFVNTPVYGDEREFVTVKDVKNTQSGGWNTTMNVTPGQELWVRLYVHNNADPSLNASGAGVAHNTKVKVQLPTATANNLRTIGFISADNANPGSVAATADLTGANGQLIALQYEPGTATATTNAVPQGYQLSDNIVNGGAPIGYTGPNGEVPGCFQFDTLVLFKVKVQSPALQITKQIAVPGQDWQKQVNATPGETLSYLVTYKNNGSTNQDHVVVRDVLPQHLDVVPGSVQMFNGVFPNGHAEPDNALFTTGGIDVGNYAPGTSGYIKFKVKLRNDFGNGTTTVTNVACARSTELVNEGCDQAQFVVSVNQPTPPTPVTPQQQLPQTGAETAALGFGGVTGSAGIGYAVTAYRKSKRALTDALRNVR